MASYRPVSQYPMVTPMQISQVGQPLHYSSFSQLRHSTINPISYQPITTIMPHYVQLQLPPPPLPIPIVRQIVVIQSPQKIIYEEDNNINDQLQEELDCWRRKFFALEAIHHSCAGYLERIESLEGRIKILRDDNRRLNAAQKEKVNEFEQLRVDYLHQEIENHDLKMAKLQAQRLSDLLNQKTEELVELRRKYSAFEPLQSALAASEFNLNQADARIEFLYEEIEQWKHKYGLLEQNHVKGLDAQKLNSENLRKSQNLDLHKNGEDQRTSYRQEVENLRAQVEKLKLENQDLGGKMHDQEVQSHDFIAKNDDLEARLLQAKKQYEKQSGLLSERTMQNEQLKINVMRKSHGIAAS